MTYREAIAYGISELKKAGIDSPTDARMLLCHTTGKDELYAAVHSAEPLGAGFGNGLQCRLMYPFREEKGAEDHRKSKSAENGLREFRVGAAGRWVLNGIRDGFDGRNHIGIADLYGLETLFIWRETGGETLTLAPDCRERPMGDRPFILRLKQD